MNPGVQIREFAAMYHRAAGDAYARGDDKRAEEFRQAAKDLEAFRKLPDIPETTRVTRG